MTEMPARIGSYEVLREIGRGGMGVVYLARDERLDREVAIKALPKELAADPDRLARFEREGKALAQLNHPNVAGIYGVEESDGRKFLILEYVEGDTLGDRLEAGPIPFDEVMELAVGIASGLEAAHDVGVIHRDLKPDNIKITSEGQVKVLDFGLAKTGTTGSTANIADSPTLTALRSPTIPGAILGTAAYMSPEQARGRNVDKRTDIWSFGVVLYEMLAGASPFVGETAGDSVGAVLHKQVDPNQLPPGTPLSVRHVLRRCLERDRDRRLRDIGDARIELLDEGPETGTGGAPTEARPSARSRVPLATALIVTGAVIGMGIHRWIAAPAAPVSREILVVDLAPPEGTRFWLDTTGPAVPVLSPDGSHVAFGAGVPVDAAHLFVRELATGSERSLPGTQDAAHPFWSPDGRHVAYFGAQKLMRIDVDGGVPQPLVDAPNGKGGSWSEAGWILFTRNASGPVELVRDDGSQHRVVTRLESEPRSFSHRYPRFLPDGERFLFIATNADGAPTATPHALMLGHIGGSEPRLLGWTSSQVELVEGHLLTCLGTSLYARDFDPDDGRLAERGELLAATIHVIERGALALFSAAPGRLVYIESGARSPSRLRRYDLNGTLIDELEPPLEAEGFDVSPDGQRLVVQLYDASTGQLNPWICELADGTWTPLTVEGDANDVFWLSNDSIIYMNSRRVMRVVLGGLGSPEVLYEWDANVSITSVDARGRFVIFEHPTADDGYDIALLDVDASAAPRTAVSTPNDDVNGLVSPDGRWIAYESNYLGRWHTFVQAMDGSGRRQQITGSSGGDLVRWNARGDGIYLIQRGGSLHEVKITSNEGDFSVAVSRLVLEQHLDGFDAHRRVGVTDEQLIVLDRSQDQLGARPARLVLDR